MTALGSTMVDVVRALKMECERVPATRTVSSLQQLCSRSSSDFKLLGKRTLRVSRAAEQAFGCLLSRIDNQRLAQPLCLPPITCTAVRGLMRARQSLLINISLCCSRQNRIVNSISKIITKSQGRRAS